MHWNVLADKLAFDSFDKVPEKFLKWQYRFPLIIQHIKEIDADIVGLSEVDIQPLYDEYRYEMAKLGYLDYFVEKKNKISGSAIFYKKEKFECLEQ